MRSHQCRFLAKFSDQGTLTIRTASVDAHEYRYKDRLRASRTMGGRPEKRSTDDILMERMRKWKGISPQLADMAREHNNNRRKLATDYQGLKIVIHRSTSPQRSPVDFSTLLACTPVRLVTPDSTCLHQVDDVAGQYLYQNEQSAAFFCPRYTVHHSH